ETAIWVGRGPQNYCITRSQNCQIAFMHHSPKLAEANGLASSARLGVRGVELIGNTPLLRLERISRQFPKVLMLAKAEWYNPGGSVKDRAAYNIVCEGRRSGKFSA